MIPWIWHPIQQKKELPLQVLPWRSERIPSKSEEQKWEREPKKMPRKISRLVPRSLKFNTFTIASTTNTAECIIHVSMIAGKPLFTLPAGEVTVISKTAREIGWILKSFEHIAMKLDSFKSKVTPNKPPVSKLPELEYVYKSQFHQKCGKFHNRIELCDAMSIHTCGRRHSFAKECDGSWMSLARFENVALQWSSTLTFKKKLERSPELLLRKLKSSIIKKQNINDKLKSTCITWNFEGRNCEDCQYVHRCSFMIIDYKKGDSICWGNHRERDHLYSLYSRRLSRHSVGR